MVKLGQSILVNFLKKFWTNLYMTIIFLGVFLFFRSVLQKLVGELSWQCFIQTKVLQNVTLYLILFLTAKANKKNSN